MIARTEIKDLTGEPCQLELANGWTVSISETDTPPAICSIAAWRTRQNNIRFKDRELFEFREGVDDERCHSLAGIRDALARIAGLPRE